MKRIRPWLILISAALLPACGGGSGDSAPPPPPGPVNLGMGGTSGGAHSGTIYVTVIDTQTGNALPGAVVSLGAGGTISIITDANGQGSFSGLAAGSPQIVTAANTGYGTDTLYDTTATNLTFSLDPLSWVSPSVQGTVFGITPGTTGNRGFMDCDLQRPEGGAAGDDASLDAASVATTSDTYQLVVSSGHSFAVSAIQTGASGNFVVVKNQPALSSGETRTVNLTLPTPAAVPTNLTGGTVTGTLPSSLGYDIIQMVMFFPGNIGGGAACGTGVTAGGFYSSTLYTDPEAVYYQAMAIRFPTGGGIGVGTASSTAPFSSTPILSIPDSPAQVLPAPAATGQGVNPVLTWTQVTGAEIYRITLAWSVSATPRRWKITRAAGIGSLTIPTLPAPVSGQGLSAGNTVTWNATVYGVSALDLNNATSASIRRNLEGLTTTPNSTFTP